MYNDYFYSDNVPTYRTAIVDECGCVICWASQMSEYEINEVLERYPEAYLTTINE